MHTIKNKTLKKTIQWSVNIFFTWALPSSRLGWGLILLGKDILAVLNSSVWMWAYLQITSCKVSRVVCPWVTQRSQMVQNLLWCAVVSHVLEERYQWHQTALIPELGPICSVHYWLLSFTFFLFLSARLGFSCLQPRSLTGSNTEPHHFTPPVPHEDDLMGTSSGDGVCISLNLSNIHFSLSFKNTQDIFSMVLLLAWWPLRTVTIIHWSKLVQHQEELPSEGG